MNKGIEKIFLMIVSLFLTLTACSRWDDHLEVDDSMLKESVMQGLKSKADLSIFYDMVVKTGYDSLLNSGVEVTVLAPDNNALQAYTAASDSVKKEIVRNHIAVYSYNTNQLANLSKLMMINGKNLLLSKMTISETERNVLCKNGFIHSVNTAVLPGKSILEYIYSLPSGFYPQADSIKKQTKRVMDMDKSLQIKVTPDGKPVYDTVWKYVNHLIDRVQIGSEDSTYTLVLLDNTTYGDIAAKYSKYMQQPTQHKTDSLVADELYSDLIFKAADPTNAMSKAVSGVNVDFTGASKSDEYEASNGTVRMMNNVNIKMYENKIKTVQIEGETFENSYLSNYVLTRSRSWASGGKDVVVSSRSTYTFTGKYTNALNQLRDTTFTSTYYYKQGSSLYNANNNFFLQYSAKLYSANYDVYWVAHDDQASHFAFPATGSPKDSLKINQKMYISYPLKPALTRLSSGEIQNNSLNTSAYYYALVGTTVAGRINPLTGKPYEVKLKKYRLSDADLTTQLIADVTAFPPTDGVIPCPAAGKATIWVTNTVTESGGLIFLDYIKLVPRVNPNE
jgi:Fasciclin domain.